MNQQAEQCADTLEATRLLGGRARFMARGATCTVFTDGTQVLRISEAHPAKAARFRVDALIRAQLHRAGVPTPLTVRQGWLADGRAYSVENFIREDDVRPTLAGWHDLRHALNTLHRLPHSGFGLLLDRPDTLQGRCQSAGPGFNSRLEGAWPFSGRELGAHPLVWLAPELGAALLALEAELLNLATLPTAVCHTDLHANQCRWQGGRLFALLDFGDASIGPPAWDWASLAYFHGWEVAQEVAGGRLEGTELKRPELERTVPLFGLLIAFHRVSRAVTMNRPQRRDEALSFARKCLKRLGERSEV